LLSNEAFCGGAIHTYETNLTLDNCDLNYNEAVYGGAIAIYKGNEITTTITNTQFQNNTAKTYVHNETSKLNGDGGAIWNNGNSIS